jgi:hypothetical protein
LPALVAAVTDNNGGLRGIHRTFLDPARNDKANVASPRRSLGVILGNGVRFGVIDDFAIIGEGIETVLSLKSALPHLSMVAALSAAHLAAWRPPSNLRRLVIAADNDEPGQNAAKRLSERMKECRIDTTTISPLGADFNSELRKNSLDALRSRVEPLIGVHAS